MEPLTPSQREAYHSEHDVCHICKKWMDPENNVKCPDHVHLTGLYRAPSHRSCNLNYRIIPSKIQIPCFFYNLKNYDAHLLIPAAKPRHGKIKCIPNTAEKYISFSIGDIIFKDSLAMTQASFDSLAKNLTTDQLINTRRWLENSVQRNDRSPPYSTTSDDSMSDDDEPMEEDPMTELQLPLQQRRYFLDNNEPLVDDNDEENIFIERSHHRMNRINSDDDDENVDDNSRNTMLTNDNINQVEEDFINANDDNFHFDDENDVYTLAPNGNGDHSDDEGMEMVEFDYRRTPYAPPSLTLEEKELVDIDLELIRRKDVYPYEYMTSFDRFNETEIPSIEAFNSRLSCSKLSGEDYAHAKKVFGHFEMKSLQDYHNLYLLQDILLLDDILLNFRKVCMQSYGLDHLHYYTAPGLTWDAGLKHTRVTLDLLTEEDKFLFVESGIRGGISVISHRHPKANHPDLPEYDESLPLHHLLYLDANYLFRLAMM